MTPRPLGLATWPVLPPALDRPFSQELKGTKVKFNEKKMTAAVIAAYTRSYCPSTKNAFSRRSFADKRE